MLQLALTSPADELWLKPCEQLKCSCRR